MAGRMIWYLAKFFETEGYADQFMAGQMYLNRLSCFKALESQSDDGRPDSTEAVAIWWQPDDIVMNLNVARVGEVEITKADLAGPVSFAFGSHE